MDLDQLTSGSNEGIEFEKCYVHSRLIGSNTVAIAKAGSMNRYSIKYHICNDYLTLIMLSLDRPCCHFTFTLFKVYTNHLTLVMGA